MTRFSRAYYRRRADQEHIRAASARTDAARAAHAELAGRYLALLLGAGQGRPADE